jgi:hypothetical protein
MAGWDFPTSMTIGEKTWEIRSDFREVLDVMEVLSDEDSTDEDRAVDALSVFYYTLTPDGEEVPYDPYEMSQEVNTKALEWMMWFIRGGKDEDKGASSRRVMDWDQDFPLIAPPVNRVLGFECRSCKYLHWWTFLGAYMEIGDCYFAQVVSIRSKKQGNKKLDKSDQEFYRKHRQDIDLKRQMSAGEEELVRRWMGRG